MNSFSKSVKFSFVLSPVTYGSLCEAMKTSLSTDTPVAIRYANGPQIDEIDKEFYSDGDYSKFGAVANFDEGDVPKIVFVTYGNIAANVIEAAKILKSEGISAGIVLVEKLKPYLESSSLVKKYIKGAQRVLFVEEGILNGGYSMITERLLRLDPKLSNIEFDIVAIDDNFAIPSKICDIYDYLGLSARKLAERAKK